jgi:hypothetical protein
LGGANCYNLDYTGALAGDVFLYWEALVKKKSALRGISPSLRPQQQLRISSVRAAAAQAPQFRALRLPHVRLCGASVSSLLPALVPFAYLRFFCSPPSPRKSCPATSILQAGGGPPSPPPQRIRRQHRSVSMCCSAGRYLFHWGRRWVGVPWDSGIHIA